MLVTAERDKKDDVLSDRFGIQKEHGINPTINVAGIKLLGLNSANHKTMTA